MDLSPDEQKEYDESIKEGYSPATMKAYFERKRAQAAKANSDPKPKPSSEPSSEPSTTKVAEKDGGLWSRFKRAVTSPGAKKAGASVVKGTKGALKATGKFLFTPGGRGYDESPKRFTGTGRYKHEPKQKAQRQREERRAAPVSPFASDFQVGGSGFSSDMRGGFGGGDGMSGGNPFESDFKTGRNKKSKKPTKEYNPFMS